MLDLLFQYLQNDVVSSRISRLRRLQQLLVGGNSALLALDVLLQDDPDVGIVGSRGRRLHKPKPLLSIQPAPSKPTPRTAREPIASTHTAITRLTRQRARAPPQRNHMLGNEQRPEDTRK